jgi:riboflavin synthase
MMEGRVVAKGQQLKIAEFCQKDCTRSARLSKCCDEIVIKCAGTDFLSPRVWFSSPTGANCPKRFKHFQKEEAHMFTGIVQGTAPLVAIDEKSNFRTHVIEMPTELLPGLELGASVAHNGCCLTVTAVEGNRVSFDLIKETLRLTNLGELALGDVVNIERAAKFNDEIGGHLMSGHIICTAEVAKIYTSENNRQVWLRMPDAELMKYVLHKGFIGIDGISLTIGEVVNNRFCVHLIPETLERTTLGKKRLGDKVNIEIDPQTQAVVDTVERVLASREAAMAAASALAQKI